MSAREKIAYLKGLMDGQKMADQDTAKLMGAVVGALDALAEDLEAQGIRIDMHDNAIDDISDFIEEVSEGIENLESQIDMCTCGECDEDSEEEDYVSVCCPHCRKDFFYDVSAYDDDEDLLCPHCGEPFKQSEI